ncbi:sensor histidine kinase [Anaeromyxobacter oryzae]|uniref:histidine kinase n=1 Tax=Anaeromyxobacter oryzae TaxID=2918170 RepID=A0ABN6MU48_9BACT|nr:HAMP domain-containing sensor histidine kinase [Anaeromyxobacter oryzae]BDG04504.1 sensor histidine kinase [Anaeromyxobacter oryzae]
MSRAADPCGGRWRRPHGALFWRVYIHGLLILVLVALAVGSVGYALSRGTWREPEKVAAYAADRVTELRRDPARLADELQRVRDVFGVQATVYGPDGAVVASSVDPPLAPAFPAGVPREGPLRLRGHGVGFAVPLPDGGGQAVFVSAGRQPDPRRPLLVLAAVLVALAIGSAPLARSIAAPVEQLTRAAEALGGGDLSARANVRARGEVGALGRAFDEMAGRLERLVRGEQELLANVSHELRTPLARIRVALELAAEGDLEKARRYLAEIGADLDELDRLVADVLSAARLDLIAGGAALPLRKERLDPAGVVAAAVERFREAWPGRTLELAVEPDLPPLDGDAGLLRRLVLNLLDNAAKYSEAPAPVTLAARARTGAVELEVRDRGIGIDPADLPRLFTPFFRTDRSRARGTGGVGLGLALARRIAAAHGGTITVESAADGTVFRVSLPAART